MEINVYGVASINLDKVNESTIKRYIVALTVVYMAVIASV